MPDQPEPRYFNTGEVDIHYTRRSGTGSQNCLFIHGITGHHRTWDDVIDPIRGNNPAIAVDLRGHGKSGRTTGAYRLPDYAGDMAHMIANLELAPATVIGHSLGAMTALQLAADRPDLVRAIVLEDPPLFARPIMDTVEPERIDGFRSFAAFSGSDKSFEECVGHAREASPDATEEEVLKNARGMFETDADAVLHVVDQRIDWDPQIDSILQAVRCPALLMQGNFEMGAWMQVGDGQRAQQLMQRCELEIWDDTGHGLHSDNPARFIDRVSSFINRMTTGDGFS